MAALADHRRGFAADQPFFTRAAIVLALLIVFAFAQFSLRGMVNWRGMPFIVHLHGVAMLAWLGVFVAQNVLIARGRVATHRRLGWASVWLVPPVVLLGCAMGLTALRMNIVPPFFAHSYFLALTQTEALAFGALFAAAIACRRDTAVHRRLMLGATVMITEPAFGRLLPMPLLGAWGGWAEVACQLAIVGVLALHDRRTLGRVHGTTVLLAGIMVGVHALIELLARAPFFIDLAARIAAA